ncbi:uncharacterized protein CANTADRAFT_277999 [Suhomyces tanzawaensis NRRL Y-17324]|uniref:Uncharacterized protein n=1 Tax=Suhomyces tanzawaensis NRRL Y-17324 TaxID=984487 RepID=A0A1E4SH37_9ASCO|nr:uncharacterized protein CANTADRAFT_277999 [Suhomyces tanzawaensis NRRL Y-17324]ODV78823.1 hypothetical protein CANTADRAFT_277999 [Suhomyces tanzawaensis NRRL Y-17324]
MQRTNTGQHARDVALALPVALGHCAPLADVSYARRSCRASPGLRLLTKPDTELPSKCAAIDCISPLHPLYGKGLCESYS